MADDTTNTPSSADARPSGDEDDAVGSDGDASTPIAMPAHPAADPDGLRQLMAQNFIEYASYVIKDRAIPDVDDGLKPVQRRILHSLQVMDDGRFHKVANVIGHTMQYHPHGDASIGSALVGLACKEYFIDRQGNFGNILTGDPASAARYIECRLTPLAREVMFNPEITEYIDSYDGRNREPVTLPAKVPALLLLGAEGIAVGMTTHIMPHNFNELLQAQIAILRNRPFRLFPDFRQGGLMDVSEYADGRGRIVLRARIEADSDKRLIIREVPATTTTESLMASIEEAARRNKIKIAGINDYTAENVEIEIILPRGVYAEEAIKQLYAYTDCQVSVSSTIMVIRDKTPVEMTVSEVVRRNTEKLLLYLRRELELEVGKLGERFHERTLVQLFIEHRVYKRIEEAETYETVVAEVRAGLEPFRDQLRRDLTDDDIDKLLQIQIRRISRFDLGRNREELEKIEAGLKQARHHLKHLVEYAVAYLEELLAKHGSQFPRRTQITDLEQVDARDVALRNVKVGHDRANHFVGSEIRNSSKTESPLLCSEFDRLVLLRNDGVYQVVPIPPKLYVGPVKYLLRAERDQVYSILYRDRHTNAHYAKRFRIDRYIMEKEYASLPKNSLIEALYTNQGVVLDLVLTPNPRLQVDSIRVAFAEIEMRSATARGFKVSSHPVDTVVLVDRGAAPVEDVTPPATADAPVPPAELPSTAETPNPELAPPPAAALVAAPPAAHGASESGEPMPKPGSKLASRPGTVPAPTGRTGKLTASGAPPPEGTVAAAKVKAADPALDHEAEPPPPTPVPKPGKSKRPADAPQAPETVTPKPTDTNAPQPKSRRPPVGTAVPPEKPPKRDPAHRLIDEETPFFLE
jgi:topoisomerase-4 subunit A